MTWEDGQLLATNGDVGERVYYRKGEVTFGRFLRTKAEYGPDVWRLHHVFTLSASSAGVGVAMLADLMTKSRCFANEVAQERARQDLAYPMDIHLPDGTGGAGRDTYETIARNSCDRAAREGRLTHAHVLEEESAEVLAAVEPAKLRGELVQLAAVCQKWVEDIDGRQLP